jgi:molybdenum cofactor cytidylyltransferase
MLMVMETLPLTAVILAAGKSSRMGQMKQLLPIKGVRMLEIVITKVIAFPFSTIFSIVGYKAEEIKDAIRIEDSRFRWVTNPNYLEGVSSSIKEAVHHCHKGSVGMLVFLGDQPLVQTKTIDSLIHHVQGQEFLHARAIVQPVYQNNPGHPVFLSTKMFPYLNELTGDQGAKKVFHYAEKQILVPVDDPGVIFDIDTPNDYHLATR